MKSVLTLDAVPPISKNPYEIFNEEEIYMT
jgi:hypothetical protein